MTYEILRRGVRVGLLLVTGCGPGTGTTTEGSTESSTGDTSDTSTPTDPSDPTAPTDSAPTETDTDPTSDGEPGSSVSLAENRDVDILFVIDNSGSMANKQAVLSQGIAALVGGLEQARANYRIGVTTTDSGNPRCPDATFKPEGGSLVLSSCVDRVAQDEFFFNDEDFSFACTDFCSKSDADLTVKPTTTQLDEQEKPRKWVESIEGVSNIQGVANNVEALQCYLPMGVAGCGFESHLESMFLALAKSGDQGSTANHGFVREAAQLAVVFVSDETDCSGNPASKEIFTTNKVFWNSPDDVAPSSGLCWRAGVACTGAGPTYEECHAENFDLTAAPGAPDGQAVLHPVGKYVDFLKAIEAGKRQFDPSQRVKVSLITGVPVGYEDFQSELVYEDTPDADYQANFGIGPGCILGDPDQPDARGVPPVRERELAEAFVQGDDHRPLYSICQGDYAGALAAIADEIADDIFPLCMPLCVEDQSPETPSVDPNCTVQEQNNIAETLTELAPCVEIGGEWVPPGGQTVCFALRVDKDGKQTPSNMDNMSVECVDEGFNLEFEIVRTAPAPPGTTIEAKCELSSNKQKDCPLL